MNQKLTRGLIRSLHRATPKVTVVLMPDFFLDHFVTYKGSLKALFAGLSQIACQGGGNIPNTSQGIFRGGNAANTASALGNLDIRPHLLLRTSPLGLSILKLFVGEKVDLSHVKTDGEMAFTVALEFDYHGKRVNVMMGDAGSVGNFGFDSLNDGDLSLIKKADVVCVFNWNLNRRGTELAGKVFEFVKKEGRGITFFDSGDPTPRKDEIGGLVENVLMRKLVDVFSLNENESVWYASYFERKVLNERKKFGAMKLAMECSRILRDELKTRIDLHTSNYTATFNDKETIVPTFSVPVIRVTGAGDAWNAADIYGNVLGLDAEQRLFFANAVAAYYISNPRGEHATKADAINILRECKLKKLRASS